MALINRISRLFRADMHAVLDRIEEPEQLLRQAIRDMEDELAGAERRIAVCGHEQQALSDRLGELQSSAGAFDAELDLCFESGREELAKALVRRKLENGRLTRRLESRFATNQRFLDEQRKQLADNQATLESMRQKAELFVHAVPDDANSSQFDDTSLLARELQVADDDVEIAFLREKAARNPS